MKYENTWSNRQKDTLESIKIWLLAFRPKTLTNGLVPILIGTVLASRVVDRMDWTVAFLALMCSLFIQIGTNLTNDALDFEKGVDNERRIGPRRATQSGLISFQKVLMGGFICFALALLCGIPLILHGGWSLLVILILSISLSYLYTGGPFPLAYHGLGDLFVLLFYGIVATSTAYYLQTGYIDRDILIASIQIGLLATAIIATNNLRDILSDAEGRKRTMAVCFGKTFARLEITFLTFLPFIVGSWWFNHRYPLAFLFPLLVLPLAYQNIKEIWLNEPSPYYNKIFAKTALIQLLFAIFLSVGFLYRNEY